MSEIEFLPEAEEELSAAATYYESKQPNLGARFCDEALKLCEILRENPLLFRLLHSR